MTVFRSVQMIKNKKILRVLYLLLITLCKDNVVASNLDREESASLPVLKSWQVVPHILSRENLDPNDNEINLAKKFNLNRSRIEYYSKVCPLVEQEIRLSEFNDNNAFFPVLPEHPVNQIITFYYDLKHNLKRFEQCLAQDTECQKVFARIGEDYDMYMEGLGKFNRNTIKRRALPWYPPQLNHIFTYPEKLSAIKKLVWRMYDLNKIQAHFEDYVHWGKDWIAETVLSADEIRTLETHIKRFHQSCEEVKATPDLNAFRDWVRLIGRVKGDLIQTCVGKHIYQCPCVLIADPIVDEKSPDEKRGGFKVIGRTESQWVADASLKDDGYIKNRKRDLLSAIKRDKKIYKKKYKNSQVVRQKLHQSVAFFRQVTYMDYFFYTPEPNKRTAEPPKENKCIDFEFREHQLEDRYLTFKPKIKWIEQKNGKGWEKVTENIHPFPLDIVWSADLSQTKLTGQYRIGNSGKYFDLRLPFNPQNLKRLYLKVCEIVDIGFLRELVNLEDVYLARNKITKAVVPNTLRKLYGIDLSYNQLTSLVFEDNPPAPPTSFWSFRTPAPEPSPYKALAWVDLRENPFDPKDPSFYINGNFKLLCDPRLYAGKMYKKTERSPVYGSVIKEYECVEIDWHLDSFCKEHKIDLNSQQLPVETGKAEAPTVEATSSTENKVESKNFDVDWALM